MNGLSLCIAKAGGKSGRRNSNPYGPWGTRRFQVSCVYRISPLPDCRGLVQASPHSQSLCRYLFRGLKEMVLRPHTLPHGTQEVYSRYLGGLEHGPTWGVSEEDRQKTSRNQRIRAE